MSKRLVTSLFILGCFFLPATLFGQSSLSFSIKNVETGEPISGGTYQITSNGKKVAKGKIMAGTINADVGDYKWLDLVIESDGFFTREIDSLSTSNSFQMLHLIPRNGIWMEIMLNHNLNLGQSVGEMVRFDLTDKRSSVSREIEMQEKDWLAVRLQSDRAYMLEAAQNELEVIDPIFINTGGMTSTFLIPRKVNLDLEPLDFAEVKEEPSMESETVIMEAKEIPKEVSVDPNRELPEGAKKVNVEAIEAEMKAKNSTAGNINPVSEAYADYDSKTIYFPSGKATLNQESLKLIDAVIEEMQILSKSLRIEVYSDTDMESTIEEYICELRADIVTSYILREGIPFEKLEVSLIGTKVLANDCAPGVGCSSSQHQANRRVKMILQ